MIIKDVMPSFELYQPTQLKDAFALLDRYGKDGWKMAGRLRQPVVVQGTHQAAQGGDRSRRHRRAQGHPRDRRRHRDRRPDDAHRDRAQSGHPGEISPARGRGRQGREPADPQCRHHRRQCLPGRALLVLPLRPAVLPRRRHHLLRRHAPGREPRACAVRLRPLRRGIAVGHGAGAGRARCQIRRQERQGRAHHRRRGFLHRAEDRHHPDDIAHARGDPHRHPDFQRAGPAPISTSRRSPTGTPGTSRWSTSPRPWR